MMLEMKIGIDIVVYTVILVYLKYTHFVSPLF
jgi:hypothetical protein